MNKLWAYHMGKQTEPEKNNTKFVSYGCSYINTLPTINCQCFFPSSIKCFKKSLMDTLIYIKKFTLRDKYDYYT